MNQFAWQERYESGNGQVDSQHRLLFMKIIACIKASRDGATREELLSQLQDTLKFVKHHFMDEEKLMEADTQAIKVHKHQHAWLANKLEDEVCKFRDRANDRMTAQGIMVFLHDWYVEHMEFEDCCFSPEMSR